MQTEIALGAKTASAPHFLNQSPVICFDHDTGADSGTVGLGANEPDHQPGVGRRLLVVKQGGSIVDVIDDRIYLSGVEDVSQGEAPAATSFQQAGPTAVRDILKAAVPGVEVKHLPALLIRHSVAVGDAGRIDWAADHQQVR